jgi:hypothetical protein
MSMVKREEWIRKARAVGRFGTGAATSEKGAYEGMALLRQALECFGNFDDGHRQGILDIVTKWANRQGSELPSLVRDMRIAHDKAKEE